MWLVKIVFLSKDNRTLSENAFAEVVSMDGLQSSLLDCTFSPELQQLAVTFKGWTLWKAVGSAIDWNLAIQKGGPASVRNLTRQWSQWSTVKRSLQFAKEGWMFTDFTDLASTVWVAWQGSPHWAQACAKAWRWTHFMKVQTAKTALSMPAWIKNGCLDGFMTSGGGNVSFDFSK